MIDAKRIAEIRDEIDGAAVWTIEADEMRALCDYALAAMEVENDLAAVRYWEANLLLRRLRAARGQS